MKLAYLVGQNDLSGQQNCPLIGRQTIEQVWYFDQKPPKTHYLSVTLDGSRQKRDYRPMELYNFSDSQRPDASQQHYYHVFA